VTEEFGDGWGELEVYGCTALHFAAGNGHSECVELLQEAGASGYEDYADWEGGNVLPLPIQHTNDYSYGKHTPLSLFLLCMMILCV
jgi:hypothetical protein